MKQGISTHLKTIMADRAFFSLIVAVGMSAVIYALYVTLSIESRDIQIVTNYSGFGESHFYKSPWYSLYTFAALGLVIGATNVMTMIKLYAYERLNFGIYLGWITLLLFVIALVLTIKVFGVAYL